MHTRLPSSLAFTPLLGCVLLAAVLGLVPGCSGSGSGSGKKKPEQSVPLAVTTTEPAGGALDVAADVTIRVVFSEDIDFATITPTNFEVEGSASGKKAGAFSHSAASKSVTFTPATPFAGLETVQVRLKEDIRSTARVKLTASTFSFVIKKVEPPPVGTPLGVASTDPRPFEAGVSLDKAIEVVFSEAVDPASLTTETVWLTGSAAGRRSATLELLDAGLRLRVTPGAHHVAGELVTLSLSRAIRATSGAEFDGIAFQFRAAAGAPPRERGFDKVTTAIGKVTHLLSGDLNLDQLADVVYSSENEALIDVLLGGGDGTFVSALRVDAGQPVLSLALSDVDGDGDLDVLAGTLDRVRIFLNRSVESAPAPGSITLAEGPVVSTGTAVRNISVGDLDHQGLPDVVLDTDRGLIVQLGGIEGLLKQTLGSSRQARTPVMLADLNGDGHADMVFGDRRGNQITYYLSTGSPTEPFSATSQVGIGTDATQLAVEDIDRDGKAEMVVLTAEGASLLGAAFRILRPTGTTYSVDRGDAEGAAAGQGGGEAEDAVDTGYFALADLEGDGLADLVLAAAVPGKVIAFGNTGGHFDFANGKNLISLPEASTAMAMDLDNDGSLDVVSSGNREVHAVLPVTEPPPPPPPGDGEFALSIDPAQVRQKDAGASALIRLTSTKPIQGYSAVLHHDASALTPTQITTDGTVTGTSAAEFSEAVIHAAASAVSFVVIVDSAEPFEGKTIPAGENQLLFRLQFDVLETAPLGETEIGFQESVGEPAISTAIAAGGKSLKPETTPGKITILPPKEPPPPPEGNRMQVGSAQLDPGAEGSVAVLGTVAKEAEAFTSILAFNETALEVLDFDFDGSVTADLAPDLVIPNILNEEGHAILTVLFDFTPPFERQRIPVGSDQLLFMVKLRAQPSAAPGKYPLELEDGVGSPPLNNIYVFEGLSVFPELVPGELQIRGDIPVSFLRGDFNANGALEISDAAAIMNHLFKSGSAPACLDAGDADDNGAVELTDSIRILNHLFQGGPAPAPPFPSPGPDPTPDGLVCEPKS